MRIPTRLDFDNLRLISAGGIFVYVFLVLFTTVWILHESPVSGMQGISLSEVTTAELREAGAPFGYTYGNPTAPFLSQLNASLALTSILFSGLFAILFLVLTDRMAKGPDTPPWWKSFMLGVAMTLLYAILLVTYLVGLPDMNYVNIDGGAISIERGLLQSSLTFVLLVLIQSAVIGTISAIWSRPLVPARLQWRWVAFEDSRGIRLHSKHWRQYIGWLITIFGGSLLTISALYIIRVRGSQTTFILHAAILFGGGLSLILLFALNKLILIEQSLIP